MNRWSSSVTVWRPRGLVDELAKTALGRYAVAVIGEEPRLAYNRVLLSSVLAGRPARTRSSSGRPTGGGIAASRCATAIASPRSTPAAASSRSPAKRALEYSKLVLATGSTPLRLNVPGADLAGVHTFRDTRDVDLLLSARCRRRSASSSVGGGLLGLEAAYGLAKAGAPVTLLHLMDRLMERQLDGPAADLLKTLVERKGIRILLNASTKCIHGDGHVEAVELADGSRIEADAVIFAAGIRPNIALAKDAGIAVNRGIVVNDEMQTASPDIYALGECAEHRGTCYGLVEPAYEQARVLARHLAGRPASYQGSVVSTNLKVSGVSVFSAGDFMGGEGGESLVLTDRQARHLQEARHRRRPAHRRGAHRRYRRCAVVSRADPQPREGDGDPHRHDVRPRARASGRQGSLIRRLEMTAIDPTLRATKTTCPYCGVGCGVLATPTARAGAAIAGDPDHPANFGRLCSKGSALGETVGAGKPVAVPDDPLQGGAGTRRLERCARPRRPPHAAHRPRATAPTRSRSHLSGQLRPRITTSPTS